MPKKVNAKSRIAVLDLETDPFVYNKMIYPFVAGFYDGDVFTSIWSDDCVARLVEQLEKREDPLIIYAHNGGRFDFFYFIDRIARNLRIVNGRIIQAWLGKHELRDSFAIMPFALDKYKKTEIDYQKFTRANREKHRDEIISYLRDDCTALHELCVAFLAEFGPNLTIGGASMKQLKHFHKFDSGNQQYDEKLRKLFYFGGRNQCFRTGIIHGPIRIYDVNSMYPHVMRDYLHPISTGLYRGNKIDEKTSFLTVEGKNYGAFPIRQKDNSLDFTVSSGVFHTSIHEFNAAIETGSFKPTKIIETIGFSRRESFAGFVDHFYHARAKAKLSDDKIRTIFYKFVLNSAYGKFAQNPENYADWYITLQSDRPPDWHDCESSCPNDCRKKWTPSFMCDDWIIWERPLQEHNYYNVATGASITGASRAVLLRGLSAAKNLYYCDTDSIICESLSGVELSETELGAWKIEAEGSSAAICGKKLYAVFDAQGTCVKKAHKGAKLSGEEIQRIATGETITHFKDAPTFKWDGSVHFIKRDIRSTYLEP